MSRHFAAGFLGLAVTVVLSVEAAAQPASLTVLPPDAHVRAADREARRLLETAARCSASVARQLEALESSDLLVVVETKPLDKMMLGQLQIVAAAGNVRYVRVSLRTPNGEPELLSTLGHELQHALEIAGAPEVRDLASQRAYYVRVGYERMGGGRFETEAALAAGRQVAKEVAACRAR